MKTVTVVASEGRNFHNVSDINLRVADEAIIAKNPPRIPELAVPLSAMGEDLIRVHLSASQVVRVRRHFCPYRSTPNCCLCYSGPSIAPDDYGRVGGTIMVAKDQIS